MSAEMGGETFPPGIHSYGEGINIALNNPKVVLDAQGDGDAVFIFHAGTTLTTCAGSRIELKNGAKVENVFSVLGTALLKSKRSSFFSCCWLLCAGTIFFAYSTFSFFSLDRLNHTRRCVSLIRGCGTGVKGQNWEDIFGNIGVVGILLGSNGV
jgi:hypothetical protein